MKISRVEKAVKDAWKRTGTSVEVGISISAGLDGAVKREYSVWVGINGRAKVTSLNAAVALLDGLEGDDEEVEFDD